MAIYRSILKPFLFLMDPEGAHHFAKGALKFGGALGMTRIFKSVCVKKDPKLSKSVFGIDFPSPVGLAAGFDKNAEFYNEISDMGFGFVEIGTVTPKPQDGNPKKRLFRLPKDRAIINRMGFNNHGLEKVKERVSGNRRVILGGNIGKNKVTPNENAKDDYLKCFEGLFEHVDYFVVNVSSPNTPGLRELQDKAPLTAILMALKQRNREMAKELGVKEKPILLKIAPDLTDDQLVDIVEIVDHTKIQGVIATNTTISRDGLTSSQELKDQAGGLSGHPLKNRSTEVIRFLAERANGRFGIIGVGGIHSAKDAMEKLEAGADLVQLYTGFVYEGPALINDIHKAILRA